MAALLVAMSIMAIFMGAALPAWRTWAQREKEAELIFRGEQYARAIGLFQRRYANATPPNLDVLVNERFLRKKYKDPITNGDFQLISPGGAVPGLSQQPQSPTTANPSAGRGRGIDLSASGGRQGQAGQRQAGPGPTGPGQTGSVGAGGVIGVVSKSSERAFRIYNGRDSYNQWVFMATQQSNRAGGPGGAAGRIGGDDGRGGRGVDGRGGRDGRGFQPPPLPGGAQPPRGGFPLPPGGGRGGPPQNPGRGGAGRGF